MYDVAPGTAGSRQRRGQPGLRWRQRCKKSEVCKSLAGPHRALAVFMHGRVMARHPFIGCLSISRFVRVCLPAMSHAAYAIAPPARADVRIGKQGERHGQEK